MDCVYYVACLQLKLLYAKPSGHMHTQNNQQYKIPLLLSGYYYSDCYYYVKGRTTFPQCPRGSYFSLVPKQQ